MLVFSWCGKKNLQTKWSSHTFLIVANKTFVIFSSSFSSSSSTSLLPGGAWLSRVQQEVVEVLGVRQQPGCDGSVIGLWQVADVRIPTCNKVALHSWVMGQYFHFVTASPTDLHCHKSRWMAASWIMGEHFLWSGWSESFRFPPHKHYAAPIIAIVYIRLECFLIYAANGHNLPKKCWNLKVSNVKKKQKIIYIKWFLHTQKCIHQHWRWTDGVLGDCQGVGIILILQWEVETQTYNT